MIRRHGPAGKHFAVCVRAVLNFVVRGKGLHLGVGIAEGSKRTECHQFHRVAGRTDLGIDLQAALQLALVVVAERAGKRPVLLLGLVDRIVGRAAAMLRATCRLFSDSSSETEASDDSK
ncbi:hypothetical protein D3C87_1779200 [compost metagenome]